MLVPSSSAQGSWATKRAHRVSIMKALDRNIETDKMGKLRLSVSPILAFLSTTAWLSNWIQYFFVWLAFQGPSRCLQNVPLFDPPIIYRHLQIGLNFQT